MTAHPPGDEARFVAKGSHGHEGTPGNTRRSEPSVNPAGFTCMSKEGIRWYPKWNHNMRTQMRSFSWS